MGSRRSVILPSACICLNFSIMIFKDFKNQDKATWLWSPPAAVIICSLGNRQGAKPQTLSSREEAPGHRPTSALAWPQRGQTWPASACSTSPARLAASSLPSETAHETARDSPSVLVTQTGGGLEEKSRPPQRQENLFLLSKRSRFYSVTVALS